MKGMPMKPFLKRWLEPRILAGILAASPIRLFAELAEEGAEGEAGSIDRALLMAFRTPGDPSDPLGPRWLEEFGRDVTGLGSIGVLSILVLAVFVFLLLDGRLRTALFVLGATGSGMLVSSLL